MGRRVPIRPCTLLGARQQGRKLLWVWRTLLWRAVLGARDGAETGRPVQEGRGEGWVSGSAGEGVCPFRWGRRPRRSQGQAMGQARPVTSAGW